MRLNTHKVFLVEVSTTLKLVVRVAAENEGAAADIAGHLSLAEVLQNAPIQPSVALRDAAPIKDYNVTAETVGAAQIFVGYSNGIVRGHWVEEGEEERGADV